MRGDRDVHCRQVAASHQPDAWPRAAQWRRQQRAGSEVGVVVVARRVVALGGKAAAVAVDHHVGQRHLALAGVEAAADRCDVDHRRADPGDHESIDRDRVRLQRQRQFDLRQYVRPARQFEGFVRGFPEFQGGVGDLQGVQPQQPTQQGADVRVDGHARGCEGQHAGPLAAAECHRLAVDVGAGAHDETHAVQRQRARCAALGALPAQLAAGRQARGDLRQQEVAAAERHQQPVQARDRDHHQHRAADGAAHRQLAAPRVALRLQHGDACLALVGRQVVGQRLSAKGHVRIPRRC